MRLYLILSGLLTIGIILLCGCVTVNVGKDNGVIPMPTVTTQNIDYPLSTKPTINENLWTPVIDNTYVLIGTCQLNEAVIPVIPNSAYRLKLFGEKRLVIEIYANKDVECDAQGNHVGYGMDEAITIANGITNYNGIFKTGSYQKNLRIKWLHLANFENEPNVDRQVLAFLDVVRDRSIQKARLDLRKLLNTPNPIEVRRNITGV